jgi:hypothetical protein
MLNDLRVRERYISRNNGKRRRRPGKTRYRHFLGVKWSQVQILSARPCQPDSCSVIHCDRVTIDSVRNHSARHYPVQNVAQATYLDIVERRAKENASDQT